MFYWLHRPDLVWVGNTQGHEHWEAQITGAVFRDCGPQETDEEQLGDRTVGSILPTLGVWLARFLGQWALKAAFPVRHKAGTGAPLPGQPERGSCGFSGQQKQNRGGSPGDQISCSICFSTTAKTSMHNKCSAPLIPKCSLSGSLGWGQSLRTEHLQVSVLETQPTSQISSQQLLTMAAIATVSNGTREKQSGWRDERESRKCRLDLCLLRSLTRGYL